MHWVVLALLFVVITKYYTAKWRVRLERRLRATRTGFQEMRQMFQEAQEQLKSAEAEEQACEERIRRLKETIEDLRMRLTMAG